MEPELTIRVSPWPGDEDDCWLSEVDGLQLIFSYLGGGCLGSSYGDYWIEEDDTGSGWRLWQTYHDYEDTRDEDEDEENEENEDDAASDGDRIFMSAYCAGRVLTAREAARTLLTALWEVHKNRGYDHPNMLDSVTDAALLEIEDVQVIIREIFG